MQKYSLVSTKDRLLYKYLMLARNPSFSLTSKPKPFVSSYNQPCLHGVITPEQVWLTSCFPGYKIQDMTHLHNVNGTIAQQLKKDWEKKIFLNELGVIIKLALEHLSQKNWTSGNKGEGVDLLWQIAEDAALKNTLVWPWVPFCNQIKLYKETALPTHFRDIHIHAKIMCLSSFVWSHFWGKCNDQGWWCGLNP